MSVSVGNSAASAANAKMIAETIKAGNQINSVALKQFNKESKVETTDMKKANSIFDVAKNMVAKSTQKGTNAQQKIEGNLAKKKKEAMGIIDNKISPSSKLIEAYQQQQAELLKQKQELEKKIKDLGGELPSDDVAEKPPETAPAENSKGKGAKKGASKSKGKGANVGGAQSGELAQLQAQLKQVSSSLGTVSASLKKESDSVNGYLDQVSACETDMQQIESAGETEINGISTEMKNNVAQKSAALQPIAQNQAKSSQSNSAVGKKSGDYAQNQVEQALQVADKDSQKQALNTLKQNLNQRKESLGASNAEGLAGKNNENATVTIPKYSSDISEAVNNAVNSDFSQMNTSIMNAYTSALNELNSAKEKATPASSPEKLQSSGGGGDTSSGTGVDMKNVISKGGDAVKSILNGQDIGSSVLGMGVDVGKDLLNNLLPGLGDGLGVVGEIFGLF